MARFSIIDNHLYVLDERKLKIFNIEQSENPHKAYEMGMRFVVETLFRYGSMIFVGGKEGIYQFKNYCNQLQLRSKIQTKEPLSLNLEQLQSFGNAFGN